MGQQDDGSILIEDDDPKFSYALEELPFFDASDSFDSEHSLPLSNSSSVSGNNHSTVSNQSYHTPESQSFPSSAGLRRRRIFSRQASKELPCSGFKNNPDGLVDTISPGKTYNFVWNLKDNGKLIHKLNRTKVRVSSCSVGKRLTDETNENSMISSVTGDGGASGESVTVDSLNSGSNLLFTLAELLIKAIAFQSSLLVGFLTFPIWLMYSSYMFLIDPFAIIRRFKSYIKRRISRFFRVCYGNLKWVIYQCIKRNRSSWELCLRIGWGLLWSVYVGLILVGLLVLGFVFSAAIMKCIMEEPVQKIEQLNFDYTRDTPMAFVPILSCPEPFLEGSEKITFGNIARSRVIPLDHRLQATISLTLPESNYNRNLGVFQVRVDLLSRNGKSLASIRQPCMLQFKSQPIRLLWTIFKLAPIISGYSSESQTLNIKFRGYTEGEVPTSCLRVAMEARAEFAKTGGVPEIYSAYLKLESQLPLLKRILWSWKATVFVWTGLVMFAIGLLFTLLCCTPIIVPKFVASNANASRNL